MIKNNVKEIKIYQTRKGNSFLGCVVSNIKGANITSHMHEEGVYSVEMLLQDYRSGKVNLDSDDVAMLREEMAKYNAMIRHDYPDTSNNMPFAVRHFLDSFLPRLRSENKKFKSRGKKWSLVNFSLIEPKMSVGQEYGIVVYRLEESVLVNDALGGGSWVKSKNLSVKSKIAIDSCKIASCPGVVHL